MRRHAHFLLALTLLLATGVHADIAVAGFLPGTQPPALSALSARADTTWLFAPSGLGAYGEAGVTDTGYSFDGTGECFTAGWSAEGGVFVQMRENIYTPGENETCLWTFFDPDTTEPGYPMGVYPYGPPYYETSISSPPLEVDAGGQGFALAAGEGEIFLRYSLYKDMPLNALVFHVIEVAARAEGGDYGGFINPTYYVYYGEDGWETWEFDLTETVFSMIGGQEQRLAGVKVRLGLIDMCPEWCGLYGTGYPHTLAAFFDNVQVGIVRDLTAAPASVAAATRLAPPQPNPFNPRTEIRFALAAGGPARLSVCDLAGRRCRLLLDAALPAGEQRLAWDGKDDAGAELASGVYFLQLETAAGRWAQKAVLLR